MLCFSTEALRSTSFDADSEPTFTASVVDDLLRVRHVLAANIDRVNQIVFHWSRLGLFNDSLLLGPTALCRGYGMGSDSEQEVVQAGLCSERGLIAVFWDRDDFVAFHGFDRSALLWAAQARSAPVAECDLVVRLLVSRQAQCLLTELCGSVDLFPLISPGGF